MLVTKALSQDVMVLFILRSSIADPQGVAQSPLQSTYILDNVLTNVILNFFLNFTNVKILNF
ncbi:hypothetical protein CWD94_17870 [Lysinibacillus xylanilyticus]|uniref:Uncharacterized protein n=1 Tax=Lysinibacillus xylanilyticus TaxID=582475 RepID=A0A2M9Q2U4_9BACI|nr:hypothetical protein CWD94_17870 [Lysinibacillus xylanilyticus]